MYRYSFRELLETLTFILIFSIEMLSDLKIKKRWKVHLESELYWTILAQKTFIFVIQSYHIWGFFRNKRQWIAQDVVRLINHELLILISFLSKKFTFGGWFSRIWYLWRTPSHSGWSWSCTRLGYSPCCPRGQPGCRSHCLNRILGCKRRCWTWKIFFWGNLKRVLGF